MTPDIQAAINTSVIMGLAFVIGAALAWWGDRYRGDDE